MIDAQLEIRRQRVEMPSWESLVRNGVLERLRQGEASTAQLRAPFPRYHSPRKRTLFWRLLEGMQRDGLIAHRKSEVGPGYVGNIWSLVP